jgi:glyoxylase-like metal-dependent hydrolase (beta-lactamase superfamily II)
MTTTTSFAQHPALAGITVLQRGWLSSNNLLVQGQPGDEGATLIDASHVNHAQQTVELVRHALNGQRLARIVNTHLHSDHCGGNAALQRAFPGVQLLIPPGQAEAIKQWSETELSYVATGQRMERFVPDGLLQPGTELHAGSCSFEVWAAPGHDPDSVMLFERQRGLLVSADALWENGFGVVFPEIVGEPGFDDVGRVLDLIESLPIQLVVPGHGAPFTDVPAALQRARSRLASFQRDPMRHARHAAKVLIKYHLMEEQHMADAALRTWAGAMPLMQHLWQRQGRAEAASAEDWAAVFVEELVAAGVLRRNAHQICDA